MSNNKPKPIMFYELAEGEFATMAQKDFNEAQAIVAARGVKVKLLMEITLHPESREHPGTAKVEVKTQVKAPARASIPFITEVSKEGHIIDSGHRQQGMALGTNKSAEGGEGEDD